MRRYRKKAWQCVARQVEDIIRTGILDLLKDPVRLLKMIGDTALTSARLDRATSFCTRLSGLLKTAREQHDADTFKDTLRPLLHRIDASLYEINITLDPVWTCINKVDGTVLFRRLISHMPAG